MTVVLWQIPISHYNEKARWALDYKGIPFEARAPMPGLHRATALVLTRGRHGRLPVARINGRRVGDSTAIIAALEEYRPEPALYPADPEERRRALGLEDYFDEELGPRVRRFLWHHTLSDPVAAADAAVPEGGARNTLLRRTGPVAARMVRRDYDIDDASAAEAAEGIRAAMDRLEAELDGGEYLVGGTFSVADLGAAAMFTPMVAPPERPYAPARLPPPVLELREELEARPGGRWIFEMYARHRSRR